MLGLNPSSYGQKAINRLSIKCILHTAYVIRKLYLSFNLGPIQYILKHTLTSLFTDLALSDNVNAVLFYINNTHYAYDPKPSEDTEQDFW
jgi:hypothetical protein